MAMGHHRPPLAIMHVNLSQQNSCYLQLDKSPNLLLSGKEPARVRISASVFSQSFYCLFFLNAPKWTPHHFCSISEDGYLSVHTFIISISKKNLLHQQ
jgi:hypothetical protein